jgi:leucyl aminopeptidase
MALDLPAIELPTPVQRVGELTPASFRGLEAAAFLLPPAPAPRIWKQLPGGAELRRLWKRRKDNRAAALSVNSAGIAIHVIAVDDSADCFTCLGAARKVVAEALKSNPASLGLGAAGLASIASCATSDALLAATAAAAFRMPTFKSQPPAPARLRRITLLGNEERIDTAKTLAAAAGTNLARWLTALPANQLDPKSYKSLIANLAKAEGWEFEYFDRSRLRRENAGAFLAVAHGSVGAGIARLRYAPKGVKSPPHLTLVGKGVCFDTGGVNLKPFKSMQGMHGDMQGSAVALGTFLACSRLGAPYPVECWLAITENLIGSASYKPSDLITASNGTTIEIVHTDAEGRMVLADTLHLATRENPPVVIDYATLTGACCVALTTRYSGVFSNRPELHDALIRSGRTSGERVWPFPLDPDFDEMLVSNVADIQQCPAGSEGDHILGARFLRRFVAPESAWIHVDLSAGENKGGLGHVPTTVTGFGVRFTLDLLETKEIEAALTAK